MDAFRPSRIAMVVAATAGVPYLFSQPQAADSQAPAPLESHGSFTPGGLVTSITGQQMPVEGVGIQHFSQALRFDVSLHWVLATWPRVTTGLADAALQGYRVPLVSGTRPQDIAGSLTYYFNPRQQVERILFHGAAGDPAELIYFLTQQHNFQRISISNPALHLYQRSEGGVVKGELRIQSLGIVRQDNPLNRWDVALVMDRP